MEWTFLANVNKKVGCKEKGMLSYVNSIPFLL